MNSLFALEQPGRKVILPIWHGITRDDVLQYGAGFADRLAKVLSTDSYADIVQSMLALLDRSTALADHRAETTLSSKTKYPTRDVSEITLEADYSNHDSHRCTFACRSVSEIPGKYVDDTSADGRGMPSEIEPPAVVAEGIDAKAVDELRWKPTRLVFKDAKTGESKAFSGELCDTLEPNTVKFAIRG